MGASITIATMPGSPEVMRLLACKHPATWKNYDGSIQCIDCKSDITPKPDKSHGGYTVLVPCDKVPGGHHYQAVGIPDPAELICGHTFVNQKHSDGLVCTNPKCGLILSGTMIDALGPNRYDRERMNLSDECGKLKRDNDELLRENAMLRRRVEKLQRK